MGNNNMYYNGRRYSHNRGNADYANSETCTECAAQRNSAPETNENDASCKELMRAIMEADFVAQDLKLYLDTHPDDTHAVEMYREAVRQYKACKATFEDTFYPLNATAAGRNNTWDWLDGTFPPLS